MGERKVINKYIPADFDPTLIPRGKKLSSKDGTVPVRMMLPFSIQCSTCHTFLYRGRKFNSKKEPMGGPDGTYLGITRWRFYIKCTQCARPLTILTDPKNADYEMESGGTRNYEVYKDQANTEQQYRTEQENIKKDDPIAALENRVLQSQKEMNELDQLEQIKAMNARHVQLLLNNSNQNHKKKKMDDDDNNDKESLLTEEDEALIRSIQFGKMKQQQIGLHDSTYGDINASSSIMIRLNEYDEQKEEERRRLRMEQMKKVSATSSVGNKQSNENNNQDISNSNKRNLVSINNANNRRISLIAKKKSRVTTDNLTAPTTTTTITAISSSEKVVGPVAVVADENDDHETSNKNASQRKITTHYIASSSDSKKPPQLLSGLLGDYGSSSDDDSDE